MSAVPAVAVPLFERGSTRRRPTVTLRRPRRVAVTVRAATAADVDAVHDLITTNLSAGHLLPRRSEEIAAHIERFVVATQRGTVVACADLAPLSRGVAEVRSLIVSEHARIGGIRRPDHGFGCEKK